MKELIRITPSQIGKQETKTCSARELHAFLQVGRDFTNWIKGRIEDFGYKQGKDYEVFAEIGDNPLGGRPKTEYSITIHMASELSMVERNAMGRIARNYFIKCEAMAVEQVPLLTKALLDRTPMWREILRYKAMGLNNVEISRLLQVSKDTLRRQLRAMERVGIIAPPDNLERRQEIAGQVFGKNRPQLSLPGMEKKS